MTVRFVCSGAVGTNDGLSWVNAHVSIPAMMTAVAVAGGDIVYVHKTHAYLAGAAITWTLPETGTGEVLVLCVDGGDAAFTAAGAAMGATVGSLTTGASESTNGNFSFTATGTFFTHGIQFKAGAGASSSSADISFVNLASNFITFQACTFWLDSSNVGAILLLGSSGSGNEGASFSGCTFKFGATGQGISLANGVYKFEGCGIAGTSPTTIFLAPTARQSFVYCSACDWSPATNVVNQASSNNVGSFFFNNCTIGTPVTGTATVPPAVVSEFHGCAAVDGTNGANILAYYKEDAYGIVQDDQTVYVTSSPAQGTQDDGTATSYSLKMTPSALAFPYQPLYTPWVSVKVAATGSKTISMKVADTEGALLKNSELWLEVEYMGGAAPANSPQSALEGTYPLVGTYHDVTAAGSNLTDSAEAWTGITETGTYTLSKTVTIDEQGYIRCRVGLGKDTTNPVYVDTRVTVA